MAARGLGGQDRSGAERTIVRCGRPLMCRSSVSEVVGTWAWDGADGAVSAGCLSDPVTGSSPGGVDTVGGSER